MRSVDRLDRAVYRAEQALCGGLFVAMVLVMGLYVVHRVFSREQGRLSTAVLKIAAALGHAPDHAFVHGPVSLGLNLALGFALAVLAMRTSAATRGLPWSRALAGAAGLVASGAAAVWLVLTLLPNGLVWGPSGALVGMLWTGFVGASLATYEKKHLALELADKLWPAPAQRWVKGGALVLTTGLCALLAALAWVSLRDHFGTWLGDPEAGTLQPTVWPRWVLLLALPVSWTMISLRFLGEGARVLAGIEPPPAGHDEA
ncbi:MAG: TRAP transporter small permease subunit [Deltaproteobacteria bacterium]|nr:TRAP transporter small permease subunit [Deltaproteobacteria bacterium]